MRCQSPSSCVVCSSAIAKARGEWLTQVFKSADAMDMQISMLTLTVRHKRGQSLAELLTAMEKAYTNVQSTQAYKKLRSEYRAKFVRVLEVTYGRNGWHPHFHIAVIHDRGVKYEAFKEELQRTWIKYLVKQGLEAPLPDVAVNIVEDASNEQRGWYLTKASGMSSLEIASKDSKRAKNGNLGIWQIHGYAVEGDLASKQQWLEYERAIVGKRIISPSRGMADFFGVAWKDDKEIDTQLVTATEEEGKVCFVGAITSGMWRQILKKHLTTEFRTMIVQGVVPLEHWLIRSKIHGHLYRYADIAHLKQQQGEILEHIEGLVESGNIKFVDPYNRQVQVGDAQDEIDALLVSLN